MDGILTLDSTNFDSVIAAGTTLVDFWAPWCGPCRMQGPILEELAGQLKDGEKIGKVNVDDNQELAIRFAISNIPCLIVFADGKPVKQFIGLTQGDELLAAMRG